MRKLLCDVLREEKFGRIDAPDFLLNRFCDLILGKLQVIGGLKIPPVTRAGVAVWRKTQRGNGSDSSSLVDDLRDL